MEILQRDMVRLKIHANFSTNCRLVRVNLQSSDSFCFRNLFGFCLLLGTDKVNSSTLQRPRNPPPPAPSSINSSRLSNGRSSESLSSMCSDHGLGNPIPPPRKVNSLIFYLIV